MRRLTLTACLLAFGLPLVGCGPSTPTSPKMSSTDEEKRRQGGEEQIKNAKPVGSEDKKDEKKEEKKDEKK